MLIQNHIFSDNLTQEEIVGPRLFQFLWRFDKNIYRKWARIKRQRDNGHYPLPPCLSFLWFYNHQQVHIAVRGGIPGGIRAEENHSFQVEFVNQLLKRRTASRLPVTNRAERYGQATGRRTFSHSYIVRGRPSTFLVCYGFHLCTNDLCATLSTLSPA